MVRLDGVAGPVLDSVLQQRHASAGGKRPADAGEHRLRVGHLVVDVGDDRPVDGAFGQAGIGRRAEHRLDTGQAFVGRPLAHDLEHLRLNVLAVDRPARLHAPRHPPSVVAGATADVRHNVARPESHRVEHPLRLFLLHPPRPLEPVGAAPAHELRRDAVADRGTILGGRGKRREEQQRDEQSGDSRLLHGEYQQAYRSPWWNPAAFERRTGA